MGISTHNIQSYSDFVAWIKSHSHRRERYRGLSKRWSTPGSFDCLPSLTREFVDATANPPHCVFSLEQLVNHEVECLRIFRETGSRFFDEHHVSPLWIKEKEFSFSLQVLTVMQHYGGPTRLLDWSYSPAVALYFAVIDHWKEDGRVLRAVPPDGESNERRRERDEQIAEFTRQPHKDLVGQHSNHPEWDRLVGWIVSRVHTPRMQAQQGVLSYALDPRNDHAQVLHQMGWTIEVAEITSACKCECLEQLEKMNVTASSLYPDAEGVGRYLKNRNRALGRRHRAPN